MSRISLHECIESINQFNKIAGNYTNIREKLLAQAKVINEEGYEYLEAVRDGFGDEEILKELCDVFVTAFGAKAQLEMLGFDVNAALLKVCENNLSKFPLDEIEAAYSADYFKELGIPVTITFNEDNGVYKILDENGKIRKKVNYRKVGVGEFTPQGITLRSIQ